MSANAGSRNSSNQRLRKLAVALRLLGKELRRLKLKRIDLRRADRRLGEKAYATGATEEQPELVSRLDQVTGRVNQLRQQKFEAASTFTGKAKVFASKIGKAVQLGALQLKRRRILRQLGAKLRQSDATSSVAGETQNARGVAGRLSSVETEIRQLRPQTYPWARQPLLLACLLVLLTAVSGAFVLSHQRTAGLAQRRAGPGRSSLPEPQMKTILAQQQTFQQQLLQMQAEAHRIEVEQTQARIAAAEHQYREQRDRERAEVEKRQREEAQERERAAAAERARVEEKQREEERRIAAAEKARREQQAREAETRREKERQEAARRAEQEKQQAAAAYAKLEQEHAAATALASSAPVTPQPITQAQNVAQRSPAPRTADSLGVERYLRSKLVGGMIERQIIEVSDLIAEKIEKAGFSQKEHRAVFSGPEGQLNMLALDSLKTGQLSSSSTKAAAKQIMLTMHEIFPKHAVLKSFSARKALPPIDEPISEGQKPAGTLISEYLDDLNTTIFELANSRVTNPAAPSAKAYANQVQDFKAGDVLCCIYQGSSPDSQSHPFYFWHKEAPAGLDELLKKLPADHPIRLIGPPRAEAPANLELAMNANTATTAALQKRVEDAKANYERGLADAALEQPGVDPKLARFFRPLFHAAAEIDHKHRADSERIVKESGGSKVLCPKCNGYKFIAQYEYDSTSINPYPWNDPMHDTYEHNRQKRVTVRCDECNGTGVVDAR